MLLPSLKYPFLQAQHPPQAGIQPRPERADPSPSLPPGGWGVNFNIYDKTSLIFVLNVTFN